MNAPLMISVTGQLVERGHSVLRFNFRGTGESSGTHDFGDAEQNDVAAAIEHAGGSGLPLGLAGWSFGAGTALGWLAAAGSTIPYVGIAPAAETMPPELPEGSKRINLGDRDQVIDGAAVQTYAEKMGFELVMTPGYHFFHVRGKKIGDIVGQGLET